MELSNVFLFGSSFAAVGREGGHYKKSLKWLERHYLDEVSWTQSGWDTVHPPTLSVLRTGDWGRPIAPYHAATYEH